MTNANKAAKPALIIIIFSLGSKFLGFLREILIAGYSGSKVHTFLKFRAPLSGEAVHAFPEVSAVN